MSKRKTIREAEHILHLAMTWRERHDKALAALDAATDRCNAAPSEAAEAAQREAQAAYDAIMDEAEVGTGRATVN
jgi:hypothetical protein